MGLSFGKAGLVEPLHVEGDESLPLLVCDLQVTVHVDDVLGAKFAREAVGPAERLGREPGQVLDMVRSPLREHAEAQKCAVGLLVRMTDDVDDVALGRAEISRPGSMRRACQNSPCDAAPMALEDATSCAPYDIPELFLRMVVLIQVATSAAMPQSAKVMETAPSTSL
jgi:hypothetical protein